MPKPPEPYLTDIDNPEWTEEDFARARPIADFPKLAAAFPNGAKPRGRPKGSTTSDKSLVSPRLDNDVLERFRATGPGAGGAGSTRRSARPLAFRTHA
jgi:uncharacterized protein (DUF4415 family)